MPFHALAFERAAAAFDDAGRAAFYSAFEYAASARRAGTLAAYDFPTREDVVALAAAAGFDEEERAARARSARTAAFEAAAAARKAGAAAYVAADAIDAARAAADMAASDLNSTSQAMLLTAHVDAAARTAAETTKSIDAASEAFEAAVFASARADAAAAEVISRSTVAEQAQAVASANADDAARAVAERTSASPKPRSWKSRLGLKAERPPPGSFDAALNETARAANAGAVALNVTTQLADDFVAAAAAARAAAGRASDAATHAGEAADSAYAAYNAIHRGLSGGGYTAGRAVLDMAFRTTKQGKAAVDECNAHTEAVRGYAKACREAAEVSAVAHVQSRHAVADTATGPARRMPSGRPGKGSVEPDGDDNNNDAGSTASAAPV